MTLIVDGSLLPEVNTVQEFVTKAQAYKTSVKTVAHYVGCSCHCILKSGTVAHTWVDKVVCREVAWSAGAPLKQDVEGVWTGHSLSLDSPVLLMTEKEYRNTLQKREEQDLRVPPVMQQTMKRRSSKHQV